MARRLTQRLQLAGVEPREEIHLSGSGLPPAAETQAVKRQRILPHSPNDNSFSGVFGVRLSHGVSPGGSSSIAPHHTTPRGTNSVNRAPLPPSRAAVHWVVAWSAGGHGCRCVAPVPRSLAAAARPAIAGRRAA